MSWSEKFKEAQSGNLFTVRKKGDYLYSYKGSTQYSKLCINTGRYFGYGDGGLVRNGERELREEYEKNYKNLK